MTRTSWNVRDSTTDALEELLTRKYKEIDKEYKMLRKVSNIEDAKKLLDEIWQMKSFANAIEMELMRREYEDGAAS
jgi:adenine C2-methylase RlmN of 23S rRNA A2503 and tRNA A37